MKRDKMIIQSHYNITLSGNYKHGRILSVHIYMIKFKMQKKQACVYIYI